MKNLPDMNDVMVAKTDNSYMFFMIPRFKFLDVEHVGPVEYENFYSKLKGGFTITPAEYKDFVKEFHSRGCLTVMD